MTYILREDSLSVGTRRWVDGHDDSMNKHIIFFLFIKNANKLKLQEGYGMRVKGIYIISESRFVNGLVALIKQVVNAKIVNRIHVLKSVKDLHEFIPKAILPIDYGGEERSLKTLQGR